VYLAQYPRRPFCVLIYLNQWLDHEDHGSFQADRNIFKVFFVISNVKKYLGSRVPIQTAAYVNDNPGQQSLVQIRTWFILKGDLDPVDHQRRLGGGGSPAVRLVVVVQLLTTQPHVASSE